MVIEFESQVVKNANDCEENAKSKCIFGLSELKENVIEEEKYEKPKIIEDTIDEAFEEDDYVGNSDNNSINTNDDLSDNILSYNSGDLSDASESQSPFSTLKKKKFKSRKLIISHEDRYAENSTHNITETATTFHLHSSENEANSNSKRASTFIFDEKRIEELDKKLQMLSNNRTSFKLKKLNSIENDTKNTDANIPSSISSSNSSSGNSSGNNSENSSDSDSISSISSGSSNDLELLKKKDAIHTKSGKNEDMSHLMKPKKSCLSRRRSSDEESVNSGSDKFSKKVSFADFHGKELFSVKTISEPSNCPPKLQSKLVHYLIQKEYSSFYEEFSVQTLSNLALSSNELKLDRNKVIIYSLNFKQPAGDYLNFQEKIMNNFVTLENVILNQYNMSGTIKVKNICFHKKVFLRCTFDSWKTFSDIHATYLPIKFYNTTISASGEFLQMDKHATSHVDTFKFEFQLPHSLPDDFEQTNSNKNVEFCVCFTDQNGCERWDNNYGKNYSIIRYIIDLKNKSESSCDGEINACEKSQRPSSPTLRDGLFNTSAYLKLLMQDHRWKSVLDRFFYSMKVQQDSSSSINTNVQISSEELIKSLSCLPSSPIQSAYDSLSYSLNRADGSDFNSIPYW